MISYGKHSVGVRDLFAVAKQLIFGTLTQGEKVNEFEERVATKIGSEYAVSMNSGTSALHLAINALDLEINSEIITSPLTFVATANCILYANLKPKFIDIDPLSNNLNLDLVEEECKINSNIKAIMVVHFAGLPVDMSRLWDIAQKYDLKIIEDAAHALGASYLDGTPVGNCKYSDITMFSFHPVKSITTGEGGIITTNNYEIYKKLLRTRSHGINKGKDNFINVTNAFSNGVKNSWYYEMQEIGYNYRLTEIQAALGISQLKKLDKFISKRRKIAAKYNQALSNQSAFKPANSCFKFNSSFHLYQIEIDFSILKINRNQIMKLLGEKGIGTQVHYLPVPLHPYYEKLGYEMNSLPNSLKHYMTSLSIPIFPGLTFMQQRKVIKTLTSVFSQSLNFNA